MGKNKSSKPIESLELFVGAGGLALGSARAGFAHLAVFDWNSNACLTLRTNKNAGVKYVRDWEIVECDVRQYDFSPWQGRVRAIFGGPPCQPFSIGGKHLGHEDKRNMFPEGIRAVLAIQPEVFVFENVKGLLRNSFSEYYAYILRQLMFPDVQQHKNEDWTSHLSRLERLAKCKKYSGLSYRVVHHCYDAADFGVPQHRERVFVVGIRSDIEAEFMLPETSHSLDSLLREQWVTGSYWERHGIASANIPEPPSRYKHRIEKMESVLVEEPRLPWHTVRDAISDLPKVEVGKASVRISNHFLNSGARSYPGHDGSRWDQPAKTLKAGDHGVPGGENILRFDNGSVRYFSVRECARLQTFPDDWFFEGSWTEAMRQLGNAVPVDLAEAVSIQLATLIQKHLKG